jgi:hypothetical protein
MAAVQTIKGHQLQILIGDGANPEVFTARCLINATRSLDLEATTRDTQVPDCDNPDDPDWIVREKDTLSVSVSGAGRLHIADSSFFNAWWKSKSPKNIQIKENTAGGQTAAGSFHLIRFRRNGDRKDIVEAEIELVSTGEVTFAANA